MKKVVVIGASCSGKTTLSKSLAIALGTEHIELDSLFWEPGWKGTPLDIFRSRVQSAVSKDAWVVDGNYSKLNEWLWSQADTMIWLDLPLTTILSRFFRRSFRRSIRRELLWNGCRESLKNSIFQKNSLLAWILKTHRRRINQFAVLMQNPPHPEMKVYRLQSTREIQRFIDAIKG
jgi:adenylate kinase family enzyme